MKLFVKGLNHFLFSVSDLEKLDHRESLADFKRLVENNPNLSFAFRTAMDEGATSAERQSAYRKAQRELEGLISLPPSMRAQIERHIAGQIEA